MGLLSRLTITILSKVFLCSISRSVLLKLDVAKHNNMPFISFPPGIEELKIRKGKLQAELSVDEKARDNLKSQILELTGRHEC